MLQEALQDIRNSKYTTTYKLTYGKYVVLQLKINMSSLRIANKNIL